MLAAPRMLLPQEVAPTKVSGGLINLGLNDGTRCSPACLRVLQSYRTDTSLRFYSTANNEPLTAAIARYDKVSSKNVLLANGSGPILRQAIPFLIRKKILSSPIRIARHLINKSGYPIIAPRLTYTKVTDGAAKVGLTTYLLPMQRGQGFRFDVDRLDHCLRRRAGLVYLCNPNNPTGQLLLGRNDLETLLDRHPQSFFWVDEAYVEYLDPARNASVVSLVPTRSNLAVSRSFSFAHGLAALHLGYLVAAAPLVEELSTQYTSYRIGALAESLAVAALEDPEHLPRLRQEIGAQRDMLYSELNALTGVTAYQSETNFILCSLHEPSASAKRLAARLRELGVLIKIFTSSIGEDYDQYFRVTVGLDFENRALLTALGIALAVPDAV